MKRVLLFGFLMTVFLFGCKKDDETVQPQGNTEIPADPGGSAPATTINNLTAIGGTFSKTPGNESRIRLNLLGITNPVTNQPVQFVANSSLFVTEDNVLQGIRITSGSGKHNALIADVVFTVDNSGSMGNEADSIASKIITFANLLQARGLDVRVGCVGYYGYVNGAQNLTTAAGLEAFLKRAGRSGTDRTVGFYGADSARLAGAAQNFHGSHPMYSEDGIVGIWFADSMFSWRAGANRVYINFTDEGLQTSSMPWWSVGGLGSRWTAGKGTIHTVFSTNYWNGTVPDTSSDRENGMQWANGTWERPWSLSTLTGGTYIVVHGDGRDLDLTTLPVTGALSTSVLVEYITANPNGTHNVIITVRDGTTADGRREYLNITY